MYFTIEKTIAYTDCDVNDRLKLSAAIQQMQQTSSEHLESLGVPVQKLHKEGMVFLLTKTCVKVHQMPTSRETVKIGTAAIETKGPRFYREFTMETPDGIHLVDALTTWILVEPHSRKIIRPKEYPYELPFRGSITQGAIADIRVPSVKDTPVGAARSLEVGYSLLDVNHHVNNSYYADMALDMLPYQELLEHHGIDTFAINYLNEALHQDVLEINRYDIAPKTYVLQGKHQRGLSFDAYVTVK